MGDDPRGDEIDKAVWDGVDKANAEMAEEQRERIPSQWDFLGESLAGFVGGYPGRGSDSLGPVVPWRRMWAALRAAWPSRHEKI